MITRLAVAAAAAAVAATAVMAQGDPIATRRGLMKSIGTENRTATEMLDGKQPFEVNRAKQVLINMGDHSAKMSPLFTDASKAGDTNALPSIWENRADFDARMTKFST